MKNNTSRVIFIYVVMIVILFILIILLTSSSLILNPILLKTKYDNLLGKDIIKTSTNSPTPTSSPTPTFTLTPIPTKTYIPIPSLTAIPVTITSPNFDDLFAKYGNQYNVDKELLKRIAGCESGFNPNDVTNDYAGLFQFGSLPWIEARGRMGLSNDQNLRFNAEESIKTAAFEIDYKGTSGWSDCNK